MEDADDNPFNTQALSFDSTLDSLLNGDFVPDDKTLPFEPSSEILMSAQKCYRADIGQNNDGEVSVDAGIKSVNTKAHNGVCEVETNNGISTDSVTEDISCKHVNHKSEDAGEFPDKFMNLDKLDTFPAKIVENTSSLGVREHSPNFDKIKEKRKRNLANQKSNKTNVNKTVSDNNTGDLKQVGAKVQTVITEEPPAKRKRSVEPSNKDQVLKTSDSNKCPFHVGTKDDISTVDCDVNKTETKETVKEKITENVEKIAVVTECTESSSDVNTTLETSSYVSDMETDQPKAELKDSKASDHANENNETIVENEANSTLVDDSENNVNDVKDNDETLNELTADSENGDYDDDADSEEDEFVDDDEIYGWLEEGVAKPEKKKIRKEDLKDGEYTCRDKHILEGIGKT